MSFKSFFFFILFSLLGLNLYALEISLSGAKENHKKYATLHLRDTNDFLCQEIKDDFEAITKIVCAFSKEPSQKIQKVQKIQIKLKGLFYLFKESKRVFL